MDGLTTRAFHQGSPQLRAYVVAECVERPAQFFTGTRGADPSRADDVATVVEALDALWDFSAEPQVFAPLVERVCRFEELVITETPDYVAETLEEGSVMFTLAAFKEALTFGYGGDPGAGVMCMAVCDGVAWDIDERFPDEGIYVQEGEARQRALQTQDFSTQSMERARVAAGQVSHQRLQFILGSLAAGSSWGSHL